MRSVLVGAATLAVVCAAPARADDSAFQHELAGAGIPASANLTLTMWAHMACGMAPQMHMSDGQVVAKLPSDVDGNGIYLTPVQASAVWSAAKRHVC